jgi:hypothetical protein
MTTSGDEALRLVRQLMAQMDTTPTGIGLINGRVLVPIGPKQVDVVGVPDGAINFYREDGDLFQQVFSFADQAWFTVEVAPIPAPPEPPQYSAFPFAPAPVQIIDAQGALAFSSNTTARVTAIQVPFKITVSAIRMQATSAGTPGTIAFGLFSSDGQTRYFTGATGSISGASVQTVTLGTPVTVEPGLYYFMAVSQSTANVTMRIYQLQDPATTAAPSGAAEPSGTVTVTAGTIPTTFNPDTGVTFNAQGAPRVMFY